MRDLRDACENLFVVQLRGGGVKVTLRNAPDTARAMSLMSKIPGALLEKFPAHRSAFKNLSSPYTFHCKYPEGRLITGEPVPYVSPSPEDLPTFASESADIIAQNILIPVFQNKKFQSLQQKGVAILEIDFVAGLMNDITKAYDIERLQSKAGPVNHSGLVDAAGMLDYDITNEELASLRLLHEQNKANVYKAAGEDTISPTLNPKPEVSEPSRHPTAQRSILYNFVMAERLPERRQTASAT